MTHLEFLRKQNNLTILLEIFLKLMHVSYIIQKGQDRTIWKYGSVLKQITLNDKVYFTFD